MASESSETITPERSSAGGGTRKWRIVAGRSRVGFRVRKMGLYYVKGRFRDIRGEVELGPDGLPIRGDAVIEAATITTRIPPRDWHLRSQDFLDVEHHPLITIATGEAAEEVNGGFTMDAQFSIHGQRQPIRLQGRLQRTGELPSLHLTGVLDRHDFGIRARQPFEMVVGRELILEVELGLERAA
jgi:polyisoprenoid-binding protein YceI